MADTLTGYLFCVFDSASPDGQDRSCGPVYLRSSAEARYLEGFFAPLYESHGVGISTSDDAVVSGSALAALAVAVQDAIASVEAQPEAWPITIGHRFEPFQTQLGAAIVQLAHRASLLEFLRAVSARIEAASRAGAYLHWGGGE